MSTPDLSKRPHIERVLIGRTVAEAGRVVLGAVVEGHRPNSRPRQGLARIVAEMAIRDEEQAPVTLLELSEITGMSQPSASKLAGELHAAGVADRGAVLATGHSHALSTLMRSEDFGHIVGTVPEWRAAVEERQRELAAQTAPLDVPAGQ